MGSERSDSQAVGDGKARRCRGDVRDQSVWLSAVHVARETHCLGGGHSFLGTTAEAPPSTSLGGGNGSSTTPHFKENESVHCKAEATSRIPLAAVFAGLQS